MRLGLICDGQTGQRASELLAGALQPHGAEMTLFSGTPPQDSALGWLPLEPLAAAANPLLFGFDAVGVFLEGEALAQVPRIHRQAATLHQQQPVTLFSGPMRPLYGDALSADLLARLDYDLLCLQGDMQVQHLQWLLRGTDYEQKPSIAIGLWCLPTHPVGHRPSQQPLLVVLDQPQIPASPLTNAVLYERLCNAARESPSWLIRLQPDGPLAADPTADPSTWPETSLCWHHHQDRKPPANLQLGQADELAWSVAQASACLGLGSDWLLPAVIWGKPTLVLGDYGIRTELNGPLFFSSGLMQRLMDCLPLHEKIPALPAANPDWLDAIGWAVADGPQRLLLKLQDQQP